MFGWQSTMNNQIVWMCEFELLMDEFNCKIKILQLEWCSKYRNMNNNFIVDANFKYLPWQSHPMQLSPKFDRVNLLKKTIEKRSTTAIKCFNKLVSN